MWWLSPKFQYWLVSTYNAYIAESNKMEMGDDIWKEDFDFLGNWGVKEKEEEEEIDFVFFRWNKGISVNIKLEEIPEFYSSNWARIRKKLLFYSKVRTFLIKL